MATQQAAVKRCKVCGSQRLMAKRQMRMLRFKCADCLQEWFEWANGKDLSQSRKGTRGLNITLKRKGKEYSGKETRQRRWMKHGLCACVLHKRMPKMRAYMERRCKQTSFDRRINRLSFTSEWKAGRRKAQRLRHGCRVKLLPTTPFCS